MDDEISAMRRPRIERAARIIRLSKTIKGMIVKLTRAAIYCAFLICCCNGPARAEAADTSPSLPAIIVGGFSAWARGGAGQALDTWQKGGLMEGDRKVAAEAAYFKRLGPAL